MRTERGGGEVPREAHNLQTLVRFQAPQQDLKWYYLFTGPT